MPDCVLPDGTYVEIKGYEDARATAKFEQFPDHLRVLKRWDLAEIFEFVEGRFGKDFLRLYDRAGQM